jgi:putative tryptophan/tyrosine transport system substrate-binding protein
MRRREIIALLGGAAAAWPLTTRAQQQPMPAVGWLGSGSPDGFASQVAAFGKGMSEAGFVEGRNVTIEYRWAEGEYDRLPALAASLVLRPAAVILASGGIRPTLAAKTARSDWVLDIDVKGYFDSIDWELLLKAVRRHTDCPWVLLYI